MPDIIFPEIDYDKIDRVRGMDITIVTSAEDTKSTHALLEAMNFPFNKKLEKKVKKVKQVIIQEKEEKKVN